MHDLLLVEFDVEYYRDLEIWVRSHSRSLKLVPFESLGAISYSPSIVTMALSCIVCEILRVIGQKSQNYYTTPTFSDPERGAPSEFRDDVWYSLNWNDWAAVWWRNCDNMLSRFHRIPERDGRADGRTDRRTKLLYQYRASVCWRAIKSAQFISLYYL